MKSLSFKLKIALAISACIMTLSFFGSMFISSFVANQFKEQSVGDLFSQTQAIKEMIKVADESAKLSAKRLGDDFKNRFSSEWTLDKNTMQIGEFTVPLLKNANGVVNQNFEIVDSFSKNYSGTVATIFVRTGEEFVRVTTSLKKDDGTRAYGTNLDHKHPGYKKLLGGEEFVGKAKLFGKEYMTRYIPIKIDNKTQGALFIGYEMTETVETIKKVLKTIKYGETGYAYILNSANDGGRGDLVIHPFKEGKNLLASKDADGFEFIKHILEDKKGEGVVFYKWKNEEANENNVREKVVAYISYPEWKWVVALGGYTDEVMARSNTIKWILMTLNFVIAVIIAVISLILVGKFVTPLTILSAQLSRSAKNLDLTANIDHTSNDEIGAMADSLSQMMSTLKQALSQAKKSSFENSSVAQQLSQASKQIGIGAEKESEIVRSSDEMAKQLNSSVFAIVQEFEGTKKKIQEAKDDLNRSKREVTSMAEGMGEATVRQNDLSAMLHDLAKNAEQIKTVLSVISDIADQTNLLALNAAIEAARAGEHGRGFAVVADEVRKLAEHTQEILSEINASIGVVTQSIGDASDSIQENAQFIQELSGKSVQVEKRIVESTAVMQELESASGHTVAQAREISLRIEEVAKSLMTISEISTSNTRNVEEIASAASHLHRLSSSLSEELGRFITN